ncbi:MAG TPA: anti-sigma factor [Candidatus Aquilonibacter sp.]
MFEHIGDLAERYALGDLDASDLAALEEHIAACDACLRLVGEAEETVLALERGDTVVTVPARLERRLQLPVRRRISFAGLAGAVAAGLVIGILATLLAFSVRPNYTQRALVAMVGSHFNHAQFAPVGTAHAAPAKVIYARDRHWLFIIATGAERYHVYAIDSQGAVSLGDLHPEGGSSTLYVDHPITQTTLELLDGSTVVARANLR